MAQVASIREQASPVANGRGENVLLRIEDFLPYRLNVAASFMSQALSRRYGERHRIGIPEWRILVTLGQFGVMNGKAIGDHSHMHKTKVSRAVALLEQRKLVTRRANREDMRESLLSLTAAGRSIYEDLVPIALDFADKLVDAIEPGDRLVFDRVLKLLSERSAALVAESAPAKPSSDLEPRGRTA